MRKPLLLALFTSLTAALASCSSECNIAGNSSLESLDGRMLYLRVSPDGMQTASLDSCQVVHGRFSFYSTADTVMMAHLYMGNERLMPVVIEGGNLNVEVDHAWQHVSGSPLNERFYKFVQHKNRLENQQWELDHRAMQLMHSGMSAEAVKREIGPKARKVAKELEELETAFIMNNYDNALGPGCFMWLFGDYPQPVLTEQIEHILHRAPDAFLFNPFVASYARAVGFNPADRGKAKRSKRAKHVKVSQ